MTVPRKVIKGEPRRADKAEKAAMLDKVTFTVAHCLEESYNITVMPY